MAKRVPFQETVKLPLKGLVTSGEDTEQKIDTVVIRAMTTLEEKMRLSSTNGFSVIPRIIKACIVEPENVDVANMNMVDVNYLMYRLRVLTYGSNYKVSVPCYNEEKMVSVTVNLNEIPVNESDDFSGQFELNKLPISGDIITCRMNSSKDLEKVERDCLRILKKYPDYAGDPETIIRWNYRITKINGEEKNSVDIRQYVESMHAQDFAFMTDVYEKEVTKYGMDLNIVEICPECGHELEFPLPVNSEFFRPRY